MIDRIQLVAPQYETMVKDEVSPTDLGQRYVSRTAADSVLEFLAAYKLSVDQH